MTTPEPESVKRTKGQIFAGWFREEAFWREVTTRTIAGLIVVAVGAVVAAVAGLIPWDPTWRYGLIVILYAGTMALWFVVTAPLRQPLRRSVSTLMSGGTTARAKMTRHAFGWVIFLVYTLVLVGIGLVLAVLVVNWVGQWAGFRVVV